MSLIEKIKGLFSGKKKEASGVNPAAPVHKTETKAGKKPETAAQEQPERIRKTCKGCGKTFSVDPKWEHIPNYCKECKQKFAKEKEEKQRAGEPRKIKRKCKKCGKFFAFPSTLPHYPSYCSNCRKARQTAMKEKYGRPVERKKGGGE